MAKTNIRPRKNRRARIIKLADVFERQVGNGEGEVEKAKYKRDKFYFDTLDTLLDEIFEAAYDRGLSWGAIARASGLGYTTVVNLGERWTKRPQLRTVMLVADALDMALFTESVEREAPKIIIQPLQIMAG